MREKLHSLLALATETSSSCGRRPRAELEKCTPGSTARRAAGSSSALSGTKKELATSAPPAFRARDPRPAEKAWTFYGLRKLVPAKTHASPSSSSMRRSWLYFARRSERHGAPVLICPVRKPTTKSAMKVSSVSPERCDTITPQPCSWLILHASMASVIEPIWFTFKSRALHAFFSIAAVTRFGFVTNKSSPTIWIFSSPVFFISGAAFSFLKSKLYFLLSASQNSDAATSVPSLTFSLWPAFSIASIRMSRASLLSCTGIAKPPSSPTLQASWPYFFFVTALRLWYTSAPICIASLKELAPTGKIMNSWHARRLPAWEPPLITLKLGTGITYLSVGLPASSAMYLYNGWDLEAAPARATAMETARIAFAP